MAFPGLIRSFDFFFFLNPGNKSIWSAILSQALYPPEVVNVVGLLAPDDWGGGGPTGSGFPAGASGTGPGPGTSSAEVLPSPSLSATRSLGQPWPAPLPQPTQAAAAGPPGLSSKHSRASPSSQRPAPTDCLSPADPPAPHRRPLRFLSPLSSKCDLFPPSAEELTRDQNRAFPITLGA